jgi:predicted Zn-dependent peptidase
VILAPMNNTEAVTLLVLVGAGSRYETKKINGVSHFLEHMFFKGTKSRPKPGQVLRELDKIGADHNAFTTKEATGFWVKTSAKDFDIALDVISDILLEPLFKEEETEKERNVIFQEIDMRNDNPRLKTQENLENIVFGDQPVGWDIAGSKKSMAAIKRGDIINYEAENYLSENMAVVAAGNFDKEKIFAKIGLAFAPVKKGKNKNFIKAKNFQKETQVKIFNKETDQTHLALAIRAYDMYDEKRYALDLLSILLGGNSSSFLYSEIREKLGLAYYVYSWSDQLRDCGYLGMAAGIPHGKLGAVVEKIVSICSKIKQGDISQNDLDSAKSYLRGQTALRFEASDEVAHFVASQELFYNEIKQPSDILKKIEAVKKKEILKIAEELFRPEKFSLAVVGRHNGGEKINKFYKKILADI